MNRRGFIKAVSAIATAPIWSRFPAAGAKAVRNVRKRIADVKDYGAIGDGIHDDTRAFRRAARAADHVWIPIGEYKITGPIKLD